MVSDTKTCEKCGDTKTYDCRYIARWDLQVCNDCYLICVKDDEQKYAQAFYEQEYDL